MVKNLICLNLKRATSWKEGLYQPAPPNEVALFTYMPPLEVFVILPLAGVIF